MSSETTHARARVPRGGRLPGLSCAAVPPFVALLLLLVAAPPSPIPAASRQMLLVTTDAWSATAGRLQRYERAGAAWRAVGAPVDVRVGRGGLGWGIGLHTAAAAQRGEPTKREGDGRAPAGVFRLSAAFGYASTEATGLPYVQTDADVECVDDTESVAYNSVRERTPRADWGSHEEMRRADGLYRIGVVVAHNGAGIDPAIVPGGIAPALRRPATRAGGSCIFLHVWRSPDVDHLGLHRHAGRLAPDRPRMARRRPGAGSRAASPRRPPAPLARLGPAVLTRRIDARFPLRRD